MFSKQLNKLIIGLYAWIYEIPLQIEAWGCTKSFIAYEKQWTSLNLRLKKKSENFVEMRSFCKHEEEGFF